MLRRAKKLRMVNDDELKEMKYELKVENDLQNGITQCFAYKGKEIHPKLSKDGERPYKAIKCFMDSKGINMYFVCYYKYAYGYKVDVYSQRSLVFPSGAYNIELWEDEAGFVYAIIEDGGRKKYVYEEWSNKLIVSCPQSYRISIRIGQYGFPYILVGNHHELTAYNKMGEVEAIGKNLKEISESLKF